MKKTIRRKIHPKFFSYVYKKKAFRAYSTPEIAFPDPIDPAAADAVLEAARHAIETAQRQQRLHSIRDNQNEQVRRLFIKPMPGWLRRKLMEAYVRQQTIIRDMCRK